VARWGVGKRAEGREELRSKSSVKWQLATRHDSYQQPNFSRRANPSRVAAGREWAPAMRGRLLEGYRRETIDRPLDWRALDFAGATAGAGFSHALDLFGDGSVRLVSTPGHSRPITLIMY
jgi:hypothetical protein